MAAQKSKSTSSAKQTKKAMTHEEREKMAAREQLTQEELRKKRQIHDEIIAIILIAVGIFLIISLQTEATGALGHFFQTLTFGLFGRVAYAIPYFLIVYSILIFAKKSALVTMRSWISIILLFLLASAFSASFFPILSEGDTVKSIYQAGVGSGGVIGMFIAKWLIGFIGKAGLYIVCVAGIIITLLFIFNTPLSVLFDNIKMKSEAATKAMEDRRREMEIEKQKKEAEAKLKAEMAAREAAKLEKERKKAEAEAEAKAESEKAAVHIMQFNEEPVPVTAEQENTPLQEENKQPEEQEEPEPPKLNTDALFNFEHDKKEERKEDISTSESAEEKIPENKEEEQKNDAADLTSAERQNMVEQAFPEGEYSKEQQRILGYVTVDENYGFMGRKSPGTGLTGTAKDEFDEEEAKPAEIVEKQPKKTYSYKDDLTADAPMTPGEFQAHMNGKDPAAQSVTISKENQPDQCNQAVKAAQTFHQSKMVPAEPVVPEEEKKEYVFPPVNLLKKPVASKDNSASSLHETALLLESTLKSFGVAASVIDAVKGPAVTRYEVQPAPGVKVSSITRLQDDIALNLRAKSLRIEAPIPGKAAVGVEVSNDVINTVFFREVIESEEFRKAKSKISMGLGRTISGEYQVADLKKMPHMLIAGQTGSGKSVCINSIIMSILYKAKPDEVKLIMIDPKVVELSNYNGIPHMLIPVVTDPAKASAALGWAVSEMNDRYNKFAETGTRELEAYNDYVRGENEPEKVMPQIVIIVDELADLIMAAQNSVEDSICRLAQKARAAGMHLIIATQRPSVNVITGTIKANVPSRIAFAVASQIDSRTILDGIGAEKLLGKGDMLYFPSGIPKPIRVQGCFVSDEEVNSVIDFVKRNNSSHSYSQDVVDCINSAGVAPSASKEEDEDGSDELLYDAIECCVKAEKCSVSMLQRRFRIGYNRAARLVDIMEEKGIVGPSEGMGARKVIMTKAQYEQMAAEVAEGKQFLDEHPEFQENGEI